jgi:fatty acid desaturase
MSVLIGSPMTSTLTAPAIPLDAASGTAAAPPSSRRDPAKAVSSFTALTRKIHDLGLMRRRYGYYWTKLIGAVCILAAWVVGFILIGDSWWQLASAGVLAVLMTQTSFLGHDAAHRQIFKSGRWNDWVSLIIANLLVGISYGWWQNKHNRHHANPNKEGADPDIALHAIAMTPAMATRHRSRLMRWLVAHQGWYFFPILLLEGLSLHTDGIRRVISRDKVQRRWLELSFLTIRLGGLLALVFLVLPPDKAVAFLAVQFGLFGLYMGSSFAPNHIGMPLVSPKLKLDFLRRQVLMSRNVSGGPPVSVFMGGLNYQIEHHLFPSMARPHLRKAQPLVVAYCAEQGVPYTQTSLWQAYRTVIHYLNTVGLKGKDPFLCPLVAQRRPIQTAPL